MRLITKSIFAMSVILLSAPILTGCEAKSQNLQAPFSNISVKEANMMLSSANDIVLIDVRTPEEFAQGHVANARNIDFRAPDFATKVQSLPHDKTLIVYCRSGNRSGQSMQVFSHFGYRNVKNVVGGISAWESVGMP